RVAERPNYRRRVAAGPASVLRVQVVRADVVTRPLDQDLPAAGTVGVLGRVTWHVPYVHVPESLLPRHVVVLLQGPHRRHGDVHHLVVRVEAQEMNRGVRPEVVVDPTGEPLGAL